MQVETMLAEKKLLDMLHTKSGLREREPKPTHFVCYTPFNALRSRVLKLVLQADLLPPLRKPETPQNSDMRKQC